MSLNSVDIDWKKSVKLTKSIQLATVIVGTHTNSLVKKVL